MIVSSMNSGSPASDAFVGSTVIVGAIDSGTSFVSHGVISDRSIASETVTRPAIQFVMASPSFGMCAPTRSAVRPASG
ncbi:hypothetical protein D3C83_175730 [compost metagenome]